MSQDSDPSSGSSSNAEPASGPAADRRTFEVAGGARSTTDPSGFHRAAVPARHPVEMHPTGKRLAILSLGALGVVYGDIGTSPLYSMQAAFAGKHGFAPTPTAVYGVLSMMLWALTFVVAVKYIAFILRAENKGEGGVLALLALLLRTERREGDKARRWILISAGIFGAALLYGDGMITPAISVLGALQGIKVQSPGLPDTLVVAGAAIVLVGVFSVQRFGTAKVGGTFGPIMAVWFATIGVLGLREILIEPRIFAAINPWYALQFFREHGKTGVRTRD